MVIEEQFVCSFSEPRETHCLKAATPSGAGFVIQRRTEEAPAIAIVAVLNGSGDVNIPSAALPPTPSTPPPQMTEATMAALTAAMVFVRYDTVMMLIVLDRAFHNN